jgi:hypothetical protein
MLFVVQSFIYNCTKISNNSEWTSKHSQHNSSSLHEPVATNQSSQACLLHHMDKETEDNQWVKKCMSGVCSTLNSKKLLV